MKKRSKIILGISIPLILLTGGMLMTQRTPFDIFLTKDFTKPTKEQQIDYLKKHEKEMTDYIKSQNAKVKSVQWDWESVNVQTGGGPIQSHTWMDIQGKFNDIEESKLTMTWQLKDDKSFPKISAMYLSQPLRIIKNGGWEYYE